MEIQQSWLEQESENSEISNIMKKINFWLEEHIMKSIVLLNHATPKKLTHPLSVQNTVEATLSVEAIITTETRF